MPDESLDPWSDEELLQTATGYGGAGADADQADPVRFLGGVAKLIRKRLRIAEATPEPAIFLLCPVAPKSVGEEAMKYQPMLDAGRTPVEGKLWLVNAVVVAGNCVPLNTDEDSAMFDLVISSLERGEVPAVIYDPRVDPAQLRFYPGGLQEAEHYQLVDIPMERVGIKRILDVANLIWEKLLVTPIAQSPEAKLWEDADRHHVKQHAEGIIQTYLKTGFCTAFPSLTIRDEQSQPTGRLDIEIEEQDPARPGHVIRHAILELKVLRSYRSSGTSVSAAETLSWVVDGVDQAYAYRVNRQALQSALCCFDMRVSHTDSCFEDVDDRARRLQVAIRRWRLYASAKDYRVALREVEELDVKFVDMFGALN